MLRLRAPFGLLLLTSVQLVLASPQIGSAQSRLPDPFHDAEPSFRSVFAEEYEEQQSAGPLTPVTVPVRVQTPWPGDPFEPEQPSAIVTLEEPGWSLTDTLTIFAGLDGSKQPKDYGINASFGGRLSANVGIPIAEEYGLGLQIGTAINYSDNAVAVMAAVDGRRERYQSFTTIGLFQRRDSGFEWALAYDYLFENYYDDITLSQFRSRVTQQVGTSNKFGVLGIWSWDDDRANVMGTSVLLRPIDQISAVWNHTWESGIETELWGGVALGHGKVVGVFGGNPAIETSPVFGAMLHAPLNDWLAIYGQGNFILPSDSGTVDAYLGFVVYFDKPVRVRNSRYSPVFDVANNTSFAVDLRQ